MYFDVKIIFPDGVDMKNIDVNPLSFIESINIGDHKININNIYNNKEKEIEEEEEEEEEEEVEKYRCYICNEFIKTGLTCDCCYHDFCTSCIYKLKDKDIIIKECDNLFSIFGNPVVECICHKVSDKCISGLDYNLLMKYCYQ